MVIKVLERRSSTPAGRRRIKGYQTDHGDVDDEATALELALNSDTDADHTNTITMPRTLSGIDRRATLLRPRIPRQRKQQRTRSVSVSNVDIAASLKRLSGRKNKSKSASKQKQLFTPGPVLPVDAREDVEGERVVSGASAAETPKNKNDHWIRSFHRVSVDSKEAYVPPSQIRITPSLLTGLFTVSEKTKRSASNKDNDTNTDNVTGYVRLLPTSPNVILSDTSPDSVTSLCHPTTTGVTGNGDKAGQTFLVWANDSSKEGGSLKIETKASIRDIVVTLEVGVVSNSNMIPLGTATFQPGAVEVRGRQHHLKVEKLRKMQSNGLFRKKLLAEKDKESEYRLCHEAFLSIKLDVKQSNGSSTTISKEARDEAVLMGPRRRSNSLADLDRTFSDSVSSDAEDRIKSMVADQPNRTTPAMPLFLSVVCCGGFGNSNACGTVKGSCTALSDDGESTCTDSASEIATTDGGPTTHATPYFGKQDQQSVHQSAPACCCFGDSNVARVARERAGTEGGNSTIDQSTVGSAYVASDGESTSGGRSLGRSTGVLTTQGWPLLFTAYCFGKNGESEVSPDQNKDGEMAAMDGNSDLAVGGGKEDGGAEAEGVTSSAKSAGENPCDAAVGESVPGEQVREPSACASCFGDADVESLHPSRQRTDTAAGDDASISTSFSGAVSSLLAGQSMFMTWCGEEDVEKLRPRARPKLNLATGAVKISDKHEPSSGSDHTSNRTNPSKRELPFRKVEKMTSGGRGTQTGDSGTNPINITASFEKLSLKTKTSDAIKSAVEHDNAISFVSSPGDLEKTLNASSHTRYPQAAVQDAENIETSMDDYTVYSSSRSGTHHTVEQDVGCIPFLTVIGAAYESVSSSDSSVSDGDDSLSAYTREFRSDRLEDGDVNLSSKEEGMLARALKAPPADLARHTTS